MRRFTGHAPHCAALIAATAILTACTTDTSSKDAGKGSTGEQAAQSAVCRRTAEGEAGDLALARCLATNELLPRPKSDSDGPVVVYFDRSASMRGFLDPSYPTRIPTDYRSVIDRLVVGLKPSRGFSFGSAVRPAEPSLVTFGNRDFYTDRDTQLEQVLAEIARDTLGTQTHIIVTDGRRGSPSAADAQYVRLREHGGRWLARGGTFIVAASLAPFQTVASDPSGCRQAKSGGNEPQTCPLYVFGFVAAGQELRILTALASVFEHVYAWPTPIIPPGELTLTPNDPARRDLRIERRWATASHGTPIMRVRSDSATNRILTATVSVRDSTSPLGRVYMALLKDQALGIHVASRTFTATGASTAGYPGQGAAKDPWYTSEARGSLIRASEEPESGAIAREDWRRSVDIVSRGPKAPTNMFLLEVMPAGSPLWLGDFDAEDASDVVRTYGLNRLFERFRAEALRTTDGPRPPAGLGRIFIVAS